MTCTKNKTSQLAPMGAGYSVARTAGEVVLSTIMVVLLITINKKAFRLKESFLLLHIYF